MDRHYRASVTCRHRRLMLEGTQRQGSRQFATDAVDVLAIALLRESVHFVFRCTTSLASWSFESRTCQR